MQRRRVHAISATGGSSLVLNTVGTIDETNGTNVHGVRASFIVEPEDASANANGNWAIYCLPDETSTIPVASTAILELEGSNAFTWAVGTWAASNETPYCKDIDMSTSRNCQRGARIVLVVDVEGLSAGNARIRSTLTYFTSGNI